MSFEKKVCYIKKLPYVLTSVFFVGIIFIAWDINATHQGDWSFNPDYISGFTIAGLPYEEILFFITVPYSIIFIYESLRIFIKERYIAISRVFLLGCILLLGIVSFLFKGMSYTSGVMISSLIVLTAVLLTSRSFHITNVMVITLLVSYIPFIIVNYFLTSLPVLLYNNSSITGIKFLTIPVEDFFYSFSMISSWLLVYQIRIKKIRF